MDRDATLQLTVLGGITWITTVLAPIRHTDRRSGAAVAVLALPVDVFFDESLEHPRGARRACERTQGQ